LDTLPIDRRQLLERAAVLAGGYAVAATGGAGAWAAGGAGRRTRARHPGPPIPRTLADAIRGPVIGRNSPGFAPAAHVYNARFDYVRPQAVARPLDAEDVRSAVRWAVARGVSLVPRSGGHSYAGYSTIENGIVLDLRMLRSIRVDRRAGTATISAGAQLIDVYAALGRKGATIPAGSCPSVGIAGHALGGGMGLAGRAFGLTADNLVGAQLVTADGRVRTVDRRTDPDLLWALRGAGAGNFGVVTELTFRLHRMPAGAAWFFISWPWSSARLAIAAWQAWAPHARDQLTSIMHLEAGGGTTAVRVTGQYLGPARDLGRLLHPLTSVPGSIVSAGDQDYLGLQSRWAGCLHQSLTACHTAGTRPGGTLARAAFRAKSDYVARPLSTRARSVLTRAVEARSQQPGSGAILFDSYGGAINRVARTATAFVHRNDLFAVQYLTYNGGAAWLGSTHAAMRPYTSGYAYQNYIDAELRDWRHAYYGSNYARLLAIKRRVDPDRHFSFPQAIGR
jgi:FAD/FMN-containing dehydrogenase